VEQRNIKATQLSPPRFNQLPGVRRRSALRRPSRLLGSTDSSRYLGRAAFRRRAVSVIGAFALAVAAAGCAAVSPPHAASSIPSTFRKGASHGTTVTPSSMPPSTPGTVPTSLSTTSHLALPTVPWDGGPTYYARFPAAAAYGWTRSSFFPISIWDAVVASPRDVAKDKVAGVNTYLNPYVYDYPAIRAAGMSVIRNVTSRGQGPEIVGYDLTDEPDGRLGFGYGPINESELDCSTSVPCGFTLMAYLDRLVPKNSGRFTYTNYTSEVITNPAGGARFLNDYQNVASIDAYYFTSSGTGCYVARVYGFFTASECPKAADYGVDVARERALDLRKPIWNFVELGTTNQAKDNIGPGEIGGAVWNSIINGAMGIDYFIEDTANGPCGETNNVLEDTSCADAISATREVTKIDRQIRALAPILNTQSYKYTFNAKLDTMLKYYDGSYYVFAMPGLTGRLGSYHLTMPPGLSASKVQVIDQDRTIPITGNAFSGSFTKEYSYHIYKITP
jgi:hypothetical protein